VRRIVPALVGLVAGCLAGAATAFAFDGVMPVPLPGSSHIFAPGPKALGLPGPNANPSSIGDFDGTVALVYLKGLATGSDGHRFLMLNDMRIMTGAYLAADGTQHRGAFAFV
jgi:hypothetical protein